MTGVDNLTGALAAVIRSQVSALGRVSGGDAQGRVTAQKPGVRAGLDESPADLATVLARRVRAIDPDDPGRHRKAFRVFLESVLLAEFGGELINDAGFHQLVEEVHLQMETDADLAPAIHAATARLLETGGDSRRA
jgi:hypothetical protein